MFACVISSIFFFSCLGMGFCALGAGLRNIRLGVIFLEKDRNVPRHYPIGSYHRELPLPRRNGPCGRGKIHKLWRLFAL